MSKNPETHHFSGMCASLDEKFRLFRAVFYQRTIGASPSGKAADFDSAMRRFESSRPSQELRGSLKLFVKTR